MLLHLAIGFLLLCVVVLIGGAVHQLRRYAHQTGRDKKPIPWYWRY